MCSEEYNIQRSHVIRLFRGGMKSGLAQNADAAMINSCLENIYVTDLRRLCGGRTGPGPPNSPAGSTPGWFIRLDVIKLPEGRSHVL